MPRSAVPYAATGAPSPGLLRRAATVIAGTAATHRPAVAANARLWPRLSLCALAPFTSRGRKLAPYATCAARNEPNPPRNAFSLVPSSATSPAQESSCAAVTPRRGLRVAATSIGMRAGLVRHRRRLALAPGSPASVESATASAAYPAARYRVRSIRASCPNAGGRLPRTRDGGTRRPYSSCRASRRRHPRFPADSRRLDGRMACQRGKRGLPHDAALQGGVVLDPPGERRARGGRAGCRYGARLRGQGSVE